MVLSDFTVLWQGMIIGYGFLESAVPTDLYAFGLPAAFARSLYVFMVPFSVLNSSSNTFLWNGVHLSKLRYSRENLGFFSWK